MPFARAFRFFAASQTGSGSGCAATPAPKRLPPPVSAVAVFLLSGLLGVLRKNAVPAVRTIAMPRYDRRFYEFPIKIPAMWWALETGLVQQDGVVPAFAVEDRRGARSIATRPGIVAPSRASRCSSFLVWQ